MIPGSLDLLSDGSARDLLDAAAELEEEIAVDPGAVVLELTRLITRRREFERLRRRYDIRR